MGDSRAGDIIRRKLARGMHSGADGGPGADQGWRLALARALRDGAALHAEVAGCRMTRRSLAELLEMPPERALFALLDGPGGGLGLIVLSPGCLSAVIEMQTIGRIAPQTPPPRRPTRTDAAMVSDVIDRALAALDTILAEEADLEWAGGFRYASFLEDPRPLGLLLEDQTYRVLETELLLGDAGRKAQVMLALPAEGRGARPAGRPAQAAVADAGGGGFSGALVAAVQAADCRLDAVIAQPRLPLGEVMALAPGMVLPLAGAALDRIVVTAIDGRVLSTARLGQHRGMRALRLSEMDQAIPVGDGETPLAPGMPQVADFPAMGQAFGDDGGLGFDPGQGLLATG